MRLFDTRRFKLTFTAIAVALITLTIVATVISLTSKDGSNKQGVQGRFTVLNCQGAEKDECPDFTFIVTAKTADGTRIVSQSKTNGKVGNYTLALEPGTYQITGFADPVGAPLLPRTAVISSKQYYKMDFYLSFPEEEHEDTAKSDDLGPPDPRTLDF
jgi:hypothetical protein